MPWTNENARNSITEIENWKFQLTRKKNVIMHWNQKYINANDLQKKKNLTESSYL